MNRQNTILNLKIPNRVRPDLTPEYVSKRIPEILGQQYYQDFRQNFYKHHYCSFMTDYGFPLGKEHPKGTSHDQLAIGDYIIIEEVGLYSRIYQRVPNERGFLILEQYADNSDQNVIVWKTKIELDKKPDIHNGYYNQNLGLEIPILSLTELEANDKHLHSYFVHFIQGAKENYVQELLDKLPEDKAEVIRKYNPDWNGLVERLWQEFLGFN